MHSDCRISLSALKYPLQTRWQRLRMNCFIYFCFLTIIITVKVSYLWNSLWNISVCSNMLLGLTDGWMLNRSFLLIDFLRRIFSWELESHCYLIAQCYHKTLSFSQASVTSLKVNLFTADFRFFWRGKLAKDN